MGLTFRKNLGRPLTSNEIDANFEFFTSSLGGATTGSNTFIGNQTITGSILISGSIIPNVGTGELTSSFDLGSGTAAWKDIYVSNGSIKFITSGSTAVTLSSQNGGISVNGGSTITANGVSGQFITSKSLDTNTTVKDSNNSLLMGPIDVETDKEIIVEEESDLTIFGDIEIQNIATADRALFATSASYSNTSSYAVTSSYSETASYALNVSCSCPPAFPYTGEATINGRLIVNDISASSTILDTETGMFYVDSNTSINWISRSLGDSTNTISLDWENKILKQASNRTTVDWGQAYLNDYTNETLSIDWENRWLSNTAGQTTLDWTDNKLTDSTGAKSVDWASRLLTDSDINTSVNWGDRTLVNSTGSTAIDYSNGASLLLTAGGSTFDIGKHAVYTANGAGSLTINGSSDFTVSASSINLNVPTGIYGFTSASSFNPNSTPGISSNTAVAFAQSGSNYYIHVYIGGRWRSASLS